MIAHSSKAAALNTTVPKYTLDDDVIRNEGGKVIARLSPLLGTGEQRNFEAWFEARNIDALAKIAEEKGGLLTLAEVEKVLL